LYFVVLLSISFLNAALSTPHQNWATSNGRADLQLDPITGFTHCISNLTSCFRTAFQRFSSFCHFEPFFWSVQTLRDAMKRSSAMRSEMKIREEELEAAAASAQ